jgi:MFS family permease
LRFEPDTQSSVPIQPVLVLVFADLLGFGMLLPDIQLRAEGLGIPGSLIGLALASTFACQSALSPYWGRLSDRTGPKRVILLSTLFSIASMLLYTRASSFWIILGSRILAGMGGANVAVAQAAVSKSTFDKARTAAMGKLAAASSAGLIVGPALGGYLAEHGGPMLLGGTAALSSTLGLIAVGLFTTESPSGPRVEGVPSQLGKTSTASIGPILLAAAVAWFGLAMLEGTFGRLLHHNLGLGQQAFGAVFAYESLIGFGIQATLVGKLSSFVSERRMLMLALIAQGLGLAAFPLAPSFGSVFAAATVYGAGAALALPALNAWVGRTVGPEGQGGAFGALQSARSFGFIVGPVLGGALFDRAPAAPYALAAIASGAAAMIVRSRPEQALGAKSPDSEDELPSQPNQRG